MQYFSQKYNKQKTYPQIKKIIMSYNNSILQSVRVYYVRVHSSFHILVAR